jgi:hypothetical protein
MPSKKSAANQAFGNEFNVTLDTIVKIALGLDATVAELLHRAKL